MMDSTIKPEDISETKFDNFFALFEQPVQFDLSQQALDQRLRLLQKRYHPDNIAKSNTSDHLQQSGQASAVINQAYQTLSHPDSRAAYLLDMACLLYTSPSPRD